MDGTLNLAIGLGMTWGRETWLDSKLCTKFPKLGIVELFAIVRDDGLRDARSAYNRLPNESGCVPLGNCGKGFCLHPFGEVINDDNGKFGSSGQWAN